jgi:hypothetical protein
MLNNYNNFESVTIKLPINNPQVPLNYFGMHFGAYPSNFYNPADISSPAPTFNYGTVRSLANWKMCWYNIEKTQGVYDWAVCDAWINFYHGLGKDIIYTFQGTPTFYGKPEHQTLRDPMYILGGGSPPQNSTAVSNFITALLTRYAGKIKYVEIFNEPFFNITHNGWWGTVAELQELANTIYNSVKAVNTNIVVISPSFDTPGIKNGDFAKYFTTVHPTLNKNGHQLCDEIGWHPYNNVATSTPSFNKVSAWLNDKYGAYTIFQKVMTGLNNTKPWHVTEYGVAGGMATDTMTEFYTVDKEEQANILLRMLAVSAAMGAKTFNAYAYEYRLFGDLCTFKGATINQILIDKLNQFHNNFCGHQIVECKLYHNGRISIKNELGYTVVY